MAMITQSVPASTTALWAGRILSGVVILFLLVDGAIKLVSIAVVTETMQQLGYPRALKWRVFSRSSRWSAQCFIPIPERPCSGRFC